MVGLSWAEKKLKGKRKVALIFVIKRVITKTVLDIITTGSLQNFKKNNFHSYDLMKLIALFFIFKNN